MRELNLGEPHIDYLGFGGPNTYKFLTQEKIDLIKDISIGEEILITYPKWNNNDFVIIVTDKTDDSIIFDLQDKSVYRTSPSTGTSGTNGSKTAPPKWYDYYYRKKR